MIHVLEVNARDELAGYRLLWKSLLLQTRHATYLQSLDWLEAHWRHQGAGEQLRVLIVFADEQALGIVPLVVRAEPSWLGTLRVLGGPTSVGHASLGPIGPNPTATLLAALRHLRRGRRDWDLIEFSGVERCGADQGRFARALEATGFAPRASTAEGAAVVELGRSWDAYWAGRDPQWREYLDRNEKLLARRGKVEFVRYRPLGAAHGQGDPPWDDLLACEPLLDGQVPAPAASAAWRRDAVASAARAGGLDLAQLMLNGRTVACSWNVHWRGHVIQLQHGFSTAAARADAGCVLLARMIADSTCRHDRTLVLGPGAAAVQRRWQTGVARAFRYKCVAPRAWRARLLGV